MSGKQQKINKETRKYNSKWGENSVNKNRPRNEIIDKLSTEDITVCANSSTH